MDDPPSSHNTIYTPWNKPYKAGTKKEAAENIFPITWTCDSSMHWKKF